MVEVLRFPGRSGAQSGGGPEDPMLESRVAGIEDDMKDVKASLRSIEIILAKIEGRLSGLEGRLTGIEGRLSGIDARFSSLPTTWTMLTIIFATWGIGSGILIFALNVLRK
ncbi:hypothetical protein HNR60_004580 [Rhodopseudomonas rhenobacensis]|uniref:Uncharacterized protein n=1 Tax=Rhodopseudomonas rhenobacensis TaxID=87461 RepID=A0A7W7Z862_9BRAD|nr:hypothetical protein [Rhodopseudomonas rhenobacensis]MBB5049796.1 hypothetical protein [Rhodopseudomonas rhenobacensis]